MDRNWQRHSALDKYKAPREDFKVHGESWVDGARELGCYRATTGVPIGSKQMARQAQGTKQHGAHIYIIGAKWLWESFTSIVYKWIFSSSYGPAWGSCLRKASAHGNSGTFPIQVYYYYPTAIFASSLG